MASAYAELSCVGHEPSLGVDRCGGVAPRSCPAQRAFALRATACMPDVSELPTENMLGRKNIAIFAAAV